MTRKVGFKKKIVPSIDFTIRWGRKYHCRGCLSSRNWSGRSRDDGFQEFTRILISISGVSSIVMLISKW